MQLSTYVEAAWNLEKSLQKQSPNFKWEVLGKDYNLPEDAKDGRYFVVVAVIRINDTTYGSRQQVFRDIVYEDRLAVTEMLIHGAIGYVVQFLKGTVE